MATYSAQAIKIKAFVNLSGTGDDTSVYTVPADSVGFFSGAIANGEAGYFRVDGSRVTDNPPTGVFIAAAGCVISAIMTGSVDWDLQGFVIENNG